MAFYYALSNLRDGYTPSWRAIGSDPSVANQDETVIPSELLDGVVDPVWDASQQRPVPRAEWRAAREEPEEALPTYSQGETVRLRLTVRDASGIAYCYAVFARLGGTGDVSLGGIDDSITLEYVGDDKEKNENDTYVAELSATLVPGRPGIYACTRIAVRDKAGNYTEVVGPEPRIRFRVIEAPRADYDPPEITDARLLAK